MGKRDLRPERTRVIHKKNSAVFIAVSGTAFTVGTILAVKIHENHQKQLSELRASRNIAWMALKEMVETEQPDLEQRLEIAQRALMRDEFNQIVKDL